MKAAIQGLAIAIMTATMAVPAVAGDRNDRHHSRDHREYRGDRGKSQSAYSHGYRDGRAQQYRGNNRRANVPRYYNDNQYNRNNGNYYRSNGNDRYSWGPNGRVNCRRPDGTTGLIVGALAGGTLGNMVAQQGDKRLGSVIGGTLGAVLGNEIAKGNASCR